MPALIYCIPDGAQPAHPPAQETAMTRYIDMTPTWGQAARIIAAALENGTDKGRDAARTELFRMAELIDHITAEVNRLNDDAARWKLGTVTDEADQHDRLSDALSVAGDACDLGGVLYDDQPAAKEHLDALWSLCTAAAVKTDGGAEQAPTVTGWQIFDSLDRAACPKASHRWPLNETLDRLNAEAEEEGSRTTFAIAAVLSDGSISFDHG